MVSPLLMLTVLRNCGRGSSSLHFSFPLPPVKPWGTQPYLNQISSAASAPVQMLFLRLKLKVRLSSSLTQLHPSAGNHLDGKVDPSLTVNLITNGPRGRMSPLIENAFLKSKCIKKMSLVFSAAVMKESTVWEDRQILWKLFSLFMATEKVRLINFYQNDTQLKIVRIRINNSKDNFSLPL